MKRSLLSEMTGRVLGVLTPYLSPPRIILDREGKAPYLIRFYLLGRPSMADGSAPFDQFGNPKPGIRWSKLPFGLYLHNFCQPDRVDWLHNHPWEWACSFILSGGYIEVRRRKGSPKETQRKVKPFTFNFLTHADFHAVASLGTPDGEIGPDVWTLFLVGPKFQGWGFMNPKDEYQDWRSFLGITQQPGEEDGDG